MNADKAFASAAPPQSRAQFQSRIFVVSRMQNHDGKRPAPRLCEAGMLVDTLNYMFTCGPISFQPNRPSSIHRVNRSVGKCCPSWEARPESVVLQLVQQPRLLPLPRSSAVRQVAAAVAAAPGRLLWPAALLLSPELP